MQIMARQVQWTRAARTDKGVHDRCMGQCIGFKVCIRFYWFTCVTGTLLRMATSQAVIKGAAAEFMHRPNQFTSPSTYASLRSAICIFSSLIFIPFKLPQLSINHYCQLARRLSKASTPRMLHVAASMSTCCRCKRCANLRARVSGSLQASSRAVNCATSA